MFYYTYVLLCFDKKFYVGCSDDLNQTLSPNQKYYEKR